MNTHFTRRLEDFTCDICGTAVTGNGYTNHCPKCLSSKHVDINPGDRESKCGGIMYACALDTKNGKQYMTHKCTKCSHTRRNQVADNDDFEALLALSRGDLPDLRRRLALAYRPELAHRPR